MIPTNGGPDAPATALEILRNKLGQYAHLLNLIPIDKVEMTSHNSGISGFIPHGIPVATINDDDDECWTAWALMTTNNRLDGLPDIWVYAIHWLTEDVKHHRIDNVVKGSHAREEFRPVFQKQTELIAILKVGLVRYGPLAQWLTQHRHVSSSKALKFLTASTSRNRF